MTHQEIVTRMSLIWHSDESIWELSLSSVYSEIARRMGHDALKLTAPPGLQNGWVVLVGSSRN